MSKLDADTEVMGVIIKRMWWKPWRWSVQILYWTPRLEAGYVSELDRTEKIGNLTLLGAIGYAKLVGVEHKDFERIKWSKTF